MSQTLQALKQDQERRKELTKNLRQQHFHVGFDKTNYMEADTNNKFKAPDLSGVLVMRQDMEKLRKDIRKEHYQLGNEEPKNRFKSTAKESFKQPENFSKSLLSEETKQDLRNHHFTLGYDKAQEQTDYKRNFHEKQPGQEVFQDKKDHLNTLRKHNHQFGDKNNYYSTMYNETINNQYDQSLLRQGGLSKQQIQEQIVELRKTNLSVGTAKLSYQSQAMQEFGDKGYAKVGYSKDLATHNVVLGNDVVNYNSQCKATHNGEYLAPDKGLTNILSKDLRKEHFSLGNDKPIYQTENAKTFIGHNISELQRGQDKTALQKTHFNVGGASNDVGAEQRYTSDYKTMFAGGQEKIVNTAIRSDKTDRASSIVLGSDQIQNRFVSEAQNNFSNTQKVNSKLDENQLNDLKTHHYQFGNDNPNMVSQQKDTYKNQSVKFQSAKLDPEMTDDLRRQHFKYGNQTNNWQTSQNTDVGVGVQSGKPAKLDPYLAKNLRTHHFQLGNNQVNYESQAKGTYKDWFKY